jgi:aminopeptidase N
MSERVLLPADVVPSHYSLELNPDFDSLEFQCNEEITVEVLNAVNEVTLHQKEIFVTSAVFKNIQSGTSQSAIEINYNKKLNLVKFVFDDVLTVGAGLLIIKYKGILNGDMAGFYKSTYSDADGIKKIMASTQFEALDARR